MFVKGRIRHFFIWILLFLVDTRRLQFFFHSEHFIKGITKNRICQRPFSRPNCCISFNLRFLSHMNTVAFFSLSAFSRKFSCSANVSAKTLYSLPWFSTVVLFSLRCYFLANIVKKVYFQLPTAIFSVQFLKVGPFVCWPSALTSKNGLDVDFCLSLRLPKLEDSSAREINLSGLNHINLTNSFHQVSKP